MKSYIFMSVLAILSSLLLAACGGDAPAATTAPDANADTDTDTVAEITLSETVTSNDGITVSYPAGWQEPIAEMGIFVYNNERAPSGIFSNRMDAGNIYVQITQTPMTREPSEQLTFSLSNIQVEFGEPVAMEGSEGFMVTGTGENMEVLGALIPVDEDTALVFIGYTHPGELEQNRDLFMQMIDSLSLNSES